MLIQLRITLLIILCLVLPHASADGWPAYYPQHIEHFGTIDVLDLNKQKLIVDDMTYHLDRSLAVHSLQNEQDTQLSLRQGGKIGFRFYTNEIQQRYITEAWILPQDIGNYKSRLRSPDDEDR